MRTLRGRSGTKVSPAFRSRNWKKNKGKKQRSRQLLKQRSHQLLGSETGTKGSEKQDLQSATSHKQEVGENHARKSSFCESFGIQLTLFKIGRISDEIASDLPLKPNIFWIFWSRDCGCVWLPFIGHLAAFPAANMVVKSRSSGSGASKASHPKCPGDQGTRRPGYPTIRTRYDF